MDDDYAIFNDARVLGGSQMALRVLLEGQVVWVPRSLVHDDGAIDRHSQRGDAGDIQIAEWWCLKEGLV